MYVRQFGGEDLILVKVLEGKVARLTKRVPTLCIEHIPSIIQELVVAIPPTWICLMRRVARAVLVYIDFTEATVVEQAKEAREKDDQDD